MVKNNLTKGENSPNLVTLSVTLILAATFSEI
jgi:hypothetical protein